MKKYFNVKIKRNSMVELMRAMNDLKIRGFEQFGEIKHNSMSGKQLTKIKTNGKEIYERVDAFEYVVIMRRENV